MKEKNENIKKAEQKFKGYKNNISELGITYKNIEQQTSKSRA